jgi:hypothetical protein
MKQLLEKPVCLMTGEEFLELQRMTTPEKVETAGAPQLQLVYGLRGLRELLGCSHTTANKIKHDPRLKGCYSQAGKKIVFDADKVLKALGRAE